jgi:hypothetical protein
MPKILKNADFDPLSVFGIKRVFSSKPALQVVFCAEVSRFDKNSKWDKDKKYSTIYWGISFVTEVLEIEEILGTFADGVIEGFGEKIDMQAATRIIADLDTILLTSLFPYKALKMGEMLICKGVEELTEMSEYAPEMIFAADLEFFDTNVNQDQYEDMIVRIIEMEDQENMAKAEKPLICAGTKEGVNNV